MDLLTDRSIRLAQVLSQQRLSVHIDPETKQTYRFLDRGEILKKYKGQKDVFGTFTSIPKLGVYPTSSYNTPIGVYCYPIDFIISTFGPSGTFEVPYPPSNRQKYLQIFRVKDISRCLVFRPGENRLITKYQTGFTEKEAEDSFEIIKGVVYKVHDYYTKNLPELDLGNAHTTQYWFHDLIMDTGDLDESVIDERLDKLIYDYFAIIPHFYLQNDSNLENFLTTYKGEKITSIKEFGVVPAPEPLLKEIWGKLQPKIREDVQLPFEKYFKALFHMVRGKDADYNEFKETVTAKGQKIDSDQAFVWNGTRHLSGFRPQTWTVLLRKLGFIGARDYGTGAIHENEPTQAIFFDPPSLEPLDIITNQVTQYNRFTKEHRDLSRWTQKFNDEKVLGNIEVDLNNIELYSHHILDQVGHKEFPYYILGYIETVNNSIDSLYKTWGWINAHPTLTEFEFWDEHRARFKKDLGDVAAKYWKVLFITDPPIFTDSYKLLDKIYNKLRLLIKTLG